MESGVRGDLTEYQTRLARPGRDQRERVLLGRFLKRSAERFAVKGDGLANFPLHLIELLLAEAVEIGRVIRAADRAEQGDDYKIEKLVPASIPIRVSRS